MDALPWLVSLAALATAGLGLLGVCWSNEPPHIGRCQLGRQLFMLTLLLAGTGSLVAACFMQRCVVSSGLALGTLLIAMLWEYPDTCTAEHHS